MPEGGGRPLRFPSKRYILITARVHPGETPASHVLDGLLQFLLRADDPRAIALRDRFVFKLIPCLNPDGVYHGHYRADTRGVNLNRKYLSATYEGHPSIVGSVAVARQLHSLRVLHLVVDIHAHAGRRGCFFYGNQQISPTNQAEAALFMNVVSLNTRWMAINGCTFFGCGSHDGSARAAFYRLTGLPLIFTLECNYNSGNAANELQRKVYEKEIDSGRISPEPPPLREISPKYDPAAWGDIGKAIALAVLDMTESTRHHGLDRSRDAPTTCADYGRVLAYGRQGCRRCRISLAARAMTRMRRRMRSLRPRCSARRRIMTSHERRQRSRSRRRATPRQSLRGRARSRPPPRRRATIQRL